MNLAEYLDNEGLKKYKFAEKTGISMTTISKICNGYKVNAFMAKTIEIFSGGAVKAEIICRDQKRLAFITKSCNFIYKDKK